MEPITVHQGGEPTDEEVAAITAAIAATAIGGPPAAPATTPDAAARWRFSGRWWTKPVPLRRARPW